MTSMVENTNQSTTALEAAPAAAWKDGKKYLWILSALVPLLVPIAWGLWSWTGLDAMWFSGPFIVFGVIPLLDVIFGQDTTNPPDEVIEALENNKFYRWVTYAYLPMQYASFFLALWLMSRPNMDTLDRIGLAWTFGAVAGIGINVAHELGHKREENERWLAKIALATTAYGHFYIEHNRGHHVRIATPEDHASSRFGESFWTFYPRVVIGSARSAWALEKTRLARLGKSPWTLKNDVLNAWLMTPVLWAVALVLFPHWWTVMALAIIAVYGSSLLESVNYLEHYGLLRQKKEDGRYERVNPRHSWNNNNVVTNIFLYQLQRHSDHHANPVRRYQALRHFDESPQMPVGYAAMVTLTYFPPLWRRVMDKRVLAHYDGDITLANIQPSKRAKVLAKYGKTEVAA